MVSILLITHKNVGKVLLETLSVTFDGRLPLLAAAMAVGYRTDPDHLLPKIAKKIDALDQGDGVLLLTDMFGSTPCNLAKQVKTTAQVNVVTGLNLPMLIRVMNYPDLSLPVLAEKAVSGGKEGVLSCQCENTGDDTC